MSEEKRADEKSKGPHSNEAWSWIMLLSGEINKVELDTSHLAVSIALFAALVAFLVGLMSAEKVTFGNAASVTGFLTSILVILVCMLLIGLKYMNVIKRLKTLINCREDIISDKLTNFTKIQETWEEYIRKYYGNFLKKLEMNEAKKELIERKEKHEEKDSGKSIDEQKEDLQINQSDIREIKESLQEIKSILGMLEREMERTNFLNSFYTIGNVLTATGFAIIVAIMVIGAPFWDAPKYVLAILFAIFWLSAGIFMIKGADNFGTDLRKNLDTLDLKLLKYLWNTNKWLFCSLLFLICAIVTLIVLLKSFV